MCIYVFIYIYIYIYRRANGIYIPKKGAICSIWTVCPCFVSDLKKIFPTKKTKYLLTKLCFSLHFLPLDPDPDPRTQINADPTGSGSTSLQLMKTL